MPLRNLFIPHGAGPCFFMEWTRGPADTWDKTATWLKGLIAGLPERPKAILVVSGHWEEPQFTVGASPRPPLIFDYFGFPEATYQLRFDAPGSPALARRVRGLLAGLHGQVAGVRRLADRRHGRSDQARGDAAPLGPRPPCPRSAPARGAPGAAVHRRRRRRGRAGAADLPGCCDGRGDLGLRV